MIKGKNGKVTMDDTGDITVADMSNWSYSGETREVIEGQETYDNEHVESFGGTPKGGDIEIAGMLKKADPGLVLAEAAFVANTELGVGDIKLFVDAATYLTPDETTTPASFAYFTKKPNNIEHQASGVVNVSMSLKVSGRLKSVTV